MLLQKSYKIIRVIDSKRKRTILTVNIPQNRYTWHHGFKVWCDSGARPFPLLVADM